MLTVKTCRSWCIALSFPRIKPLPVLCKRVWGTWENLVLCEGTCRSNVSRLIARSVSCRCSQEWLAELRLFQESFSRLWLSQDHLCRRIKALHIILQTMELNFASAIELLKLESLGKLIQWFSVLISCSHSTHVYAYINHLIWKKQTIPDADLIIQSLKDSSC